MFINNYPQVKEIDSQDYLIIRAMICFLEFYESYSDFSIFSEISLNINLDLVFNLFFLDFSDLYFKYLFDFIIKLIIESEDFKSKVMESIPEDLMLKFLNPRNLYYWEPMKDYIQAFYDSFNIFVEKNQRLIVLMFNIIDCKFCVLHMEILIYFMNI